MSRRALRGLAALVAFALVGTAHAEPRVAPDAESIRPIEAGSSVPSATVRTLDGEAIDLASLTADRGALLVFYRGGW